MNTLNKILCLSAFVVSTSLFSTTAFAQGNNCWGQAAAVFAQFGEMGKHASEQESPRLGLGRLARILFEAGEISEPTIAALGVFVAVEANLDIDGCMGDAEAIEDAEAAVAADAACWGQASAVFAQMGLMGQHASQQDNPFFGMRNLARALAEIGLIPDDSMASLGAFVANELGLEITACQ